MSIRVATTGDVREFIERVQPRYKYGTLSVKSGRVYHKIIQDSSGQRSVYGFVSSNGNIYMAASWAKPAKHVRGNIFSPDGGLEALDAQGFIRYLR